MSIDRRAIRQEEQERAALDDLIADMDRWIDARLATIKIQDPPEGASLEQWGKAEVDRVIGQMADINREAKVLLARARARAVNLGVDASGRLVQAQLPTAREVRDGHHDTDRTG